MYNKQNALITSMQSIMRSFGISITRARDYVPPTGVLIDHELQVEFEKALSIVRANTMLARERLSILYEIVQYITKENIPGSIVECGVWKGGAVGMLAHSCNYFGTIRDLWLFDSFDDICECDETIDGERAIRESGGYTKGRLVPIKGIYDPMGGHGTIEECKRLIIDKIKYPESRVHFRKGWFQETMSEGVPEIVDISILRIDADWYASTKICLETLYDRVVPGGAVIIDDYGAYDGCKKAVDEFRNKNQISTFRNHVDRECIYWFKG